MRKQLAAILAAIIIVLAGVAGAGTVTTTATAATAHPCFAYVVKDTSGPGLKNFRAKDPWCNKYGTQGLGPWYGPWRYTSGGALIDAEQHNSATS